MKVSNMKRALQARGYYYQRHPGVVASMLHNDDIGARTRDIREVIRDVVREELQKLLPAANPPESLCISEAFREEIHQTLRQEVPGAMLAQEEPMLSYTAIARLLPPVAR